MASTPRLSLIIPARNEAAYLPALLDSVAVARARYERGADALEVIVADNASTDATPRLARDHGCRVVMEPERCIAVVRNAGARAASGEFLAFVDADTRIHRDTFDAIDRCMSSPLIVAGSTGVTLDRWSAGRAVTYGLMASLARLTRIDTGVVFCRRRDFLTAGGYDESVRFTEDVRLMLALRRLGRGRGQRLARLRSVKAIASTRKFDEHGEWHYFGIMARAVRQIVRPAGSDDFVDRYWYGTDR